jgi:hypothetical protein
MISFQGKQTLERKWPNIKRGVMNTDEDAQKISLTLIFRK